MAQFFGWQAKLRLARSLITKEHPIYVQYYVTARCDLACEQCNVIYSNADVREATTDEARKIAENLAAIGTSVVLLTGGEPFCRQDLPEIVRAFVENGIHVRLQTNGLATAKALEACVKAGANDISISLDSLVPDTQEAINGDVPNSWKRAIETMSWVNQNFPSDSFAALGCVLAPKNILHVPDVVRFATEIGWWVSLVPAHTVKPNHPMSFRTYNPEVSFSSEKWPIVDRVLDEVKELRKQGHHVYDSDEYIDDIKRMVRGLPLTWRDRNGGVCDSPNLYFAVLPNGQLAPCCDLRIDRKVSVASDEFPDNYFTRQLRRDVMEVTSQCEGCLFGSFPEISISSRYFIPMLKRTLLFGFQQTSRQLHPYTGAEMLAKADRIRAEAQELHA